MGCAIGTEVIRTPEPDLAIAGPVQRREDRSGEGSGVADRNQASDRAALQDLAHATPAVRGHDRTAARESFDQNIG